MMHGLFLLSSRDIRWCLIIFIVMRCLLSLWAGVVLWVYPIEADWRTSSLIPYRQVVPTGDSDRNAIWDAILVLFHKTNLDFCGK
jgi:hypothetical protein